MNSLGHATSLRRYEAPAATSEVTAELARAILRGVPPKDIATVYGISVRTAYRWRAELVAVESVRVDGWRATFVRRRRLPPVRVSAWERVA